MLDYTPPLYEAVLLRPASENSSLGFFQIAVNRIKGRVCSPRHWHDYFQIWYTLEGEYLQTVEEDAYLQRPGTMVVIPPFTEHRWDTSAVPLAERSIIRIGIRRDTPLPLLSLGRGQAAYDNRLLPVSHCFTGAEFERAQQIVRSMVEEVEKKAQMSQKQVREFLRALLSLYAGAAGIPADPQQLDKDRGRMEEMVRAAEFITAHRAEPLGLDRVAEFLLISRRSLSDTFFRCMGRTVHEYLLAERLRAAFHCLRTTTDSVEAVALRCGFANSSHLSSRFKEAFLCTPLQCRKAISRWQKNYGDAAFQEAIKEMRWFTLPTEQSLINHYTSMSFE